MAQSELGIWTLQEACLSRLALTRRRAKKLVLEADEKEIHDARTAVRRMRACLAIATRAARHRRSLVEFDELCKKFLKVSGPARDLDVIVATLTKEGYPEIAAVSKRVKVPRRESAERGQKVAARMVREAPDGIELRRDDDSAVGRRFDKEVRRLDLELGVRMAHVVQDESDVKGLHAARQLLRDLRYILELRDGDRGTGTAMSLSPWQDMLGEIRDLDISVRYVEEPPVSVVSRGFAIKLRAKRHQKYLDLVTKCKAATDPGDGTLSFTGSKAG